MQDNLSNLRPLPLTRYAKSPLPCKTTYSEILGIKTWISLGAIIFAYSKYLTLSEIVYLFLYALTVFIILLKLKLTTDPECLETRLAYSKYAKLFHISMTERMTDFHSKSLNDCYTYFSINHCTTLLFLLKL